MTYFGSNVDYSCQLVKGVVETLHCNKVSILYYQQTSDLTAKATQQLHNNYSVTLWDNTLHMTGFHYLCHKVYIYN